MQRRIWFVYWIMEASCADCATAWAYRGHDTDKMNRQLESARHHAKHAQHLVHIETRRKEHRSWREMTEQERTALAS